MLKALISLNADLQRLQQEGFVMEERGGWLIVHHIPYLNDARLIREGTLLMPLCTSGDRTIRPNDHTAYWIGDRPCDVKGDPLPSLVNSAVQKAICNGYTANFYFSCHAEKEEFPPNGDYPDYYEKVKHYFDIIAAPALNLDSDAWLRLNIGIESIQEETPFRYMDTNASRAGITTLSDKFKGLKVGIIGLGGTGSYILDLIAKIPVAEIHLFDGDEINTHNAFRAPGAMSESDLSKAPKKVEYYAGIYGNMHKGIIPHVEMINSESLPHLDCLNYVFLSLDSVEAKQQIAAYLLDHGIPFIDSGMGIEQEQDGRLSGMLHIAIGTAGCYKHLPQIMGSVDAEKDLYATDIQIAELNSLAAVFSVIRWKKMLGFYVDKRQEPYSVYTINYNELDNAKEEET